LEHLRASIIGSGLSYDDSGGSCVSRVVGIVSNISVDVGGGGDLCAISAGFSGCDGAFAFSATFTPGTPIVLVLVLVVLFYLIVLVIPVAGGSDDI
jgi:hypothetical protein